MDTALFLYRGKAIHPWQKRAAQKPEGDRSVVQRRTTVLAATSPCGIPEDNGSWFKIRGNGQQQALQKSGGPQPGKTGIAGSLAFAEKWTGPAPER